MAYRPVPIKRESVITKAAAEIHRYVVSMGLHAGDRLPTETELSRMLSISRNSVREALRILEALYVIDKRPGRGAVLRSASASLEAYAGDRAVLLHAAPIAFQVRMMLEQKCARLAAESGSDADFAEMEGHLHGIQDAMKRGDFVAAAEAHRAFHDTLVAAAHNPILESIYRQVRFIPSEIVPRGHDIYKDHRHLEMHLAIFRAVQARKPARATAEMRKHFHVVKPLVDFIIRPQHEPKSGTVARRSARRRSVRKLARPHG